MNHLIFGGSGFIGTHLKQYLLEHGIMADKIHVFDLQKKKDDNYTELDVRQSFKIDAPNLSNAIIYNFAAVHITPGHKASEYFETNVFGAQNVCNFAQTNNINKIVFTSSIAVYGTSENCKDENTLPMPDTPYGVSKLNAEYIYKVWQAEAPTKRTLTIVRPGAVFGKFEKGNFTRLYQLLKRNIFYYPGRMDTKKSLVYVKDVARILFEVAESEMPSTQTLNLSYFPAPSIKMICESIANVTGLQKPKIIIPGWLLTSVASIVYYISRAMRIKTIGIHPERVKKLMISSNISGEKLSNTKYKLQYSLDAAIKDWFEECNKEELS